MLSGEYGVLDGGSCIATTLKSEMQVEVIKREDQRIVVSSDIWPKTLSFSKVADLDEGTPALHAVKFALQKYRMTGVEVSISSNFNTSFGFGSSSALRLGILLGMRALAIRSYPAFEERLEVLEDARKLQATFQKLGSGYDFVTQFYGGLVHIDFSKTPYEVGHFSSDLNLSRVFHPVVGGDGDVTAHSVVNTLDWLHGRDLYREFRSSMDELVLSMKSLLDEKSFDVSSVIRANARVQSIMRECPSYPSVVKKLESLSGYNDLWTVKPTGAGGEDALLFIGPETELEEAFSVVKNAGWKKLENEFASSHASISLNEENNGSN